MKTPSEIVDGAFGNTVPIHREGLEKWVATIQRDAFEAGRVEGLEKAVDLVSGRLKWDMTAGYRIAIEECCVFLKAEIDRVKSGGEHVTTTPNP